MPVNPALKEVLGHAVLPRSRRGAGGGAASRPGTGIDLVDVFRASEHVPAIVDDVIRLGIPYLWLQDEVIHDEAVARARAAGVKCVQNDCIYREHAKAESGAIAGSCISDACAILRLSRRRVRTAAHQAHQRHSPMSRLRRVNWSMSAFRSMRHFRLIFALFAAAAALPALAASSSADVAAPARAAGRARTTSFTPARRNDAGLYFKLEPGWHVYWKNAGDSGEPPHIKWTLPAGVTAGAARVSRAEAAAARPADGLRLRKRSPVSVLASMLPNRCKRGPAALHAKVDWLVCREVCIPGKAELEITRDIAARAQPAGERRFRP